METYSFTHLHTHSHFSLLEAVPTIDELVDMAKKDGMSALALTDNGNLYAAIEFYQACKKAGIKPIIGVDAYLAPRTRFLKEHGIDDPEARLVLLAKNFAGYQNLLALVTLSHTEGFHIKPRIDTELLERYSENLHAIIPSFQGDVARALASGNTQGAKEKIDVYKKIFGENVSLEITRHSEVPEHEPLMQKIIACGKEMGVPILAASDVYYLAPGDKRACETMQKIGEGGTLEDEDGFDATPDLSFLTQKKALRLFRDLPEALAHTAEIADSCNVEIELGKWHFPNFPIESGKTPDEELTALAEKGISWRGLPENAEVRERLTYELAVIKMKGYATYFLVVGDLLREARARGILTNIRGSVSGSLTTFVLGITNINPLEYQIPFERFLNPERPSAPDIDMDFADNRRDEMIEYVREKYGRDRVAQIGTFGTMMARAAVRDTARALGHPYGIGDRIAKLIPFGAQGFPMTIDRAMESEKDLKELYKTDAVVREVIDLAKKIEGRARHIGVHAAGVVIAPDTLMKYTPLQLDPKGGKLITQYEMNAVGEDGVGLLKYDFLGIKNLSILADAIARVKKLHGTEIDLDRIPLDDVKTFAMLARGETEGTFQLNGAAMTRYLKELRPSTIHDINAMVALFRPGPMQFIPLYIERKHHPERITYPDHALEPILKKTYGVLVYQDDLLLMAKNLAGYSWGEVDKFRKAVGKKIPEEMAKQKEKFISGCMETSGWARAKAEEIWKWIEPFAAYGFNKSHSVSYGRVAYQTAYLKANWPLQYMAALMTADAGDTEEIAKFVAECARMDIRVLAPDVNESYEDFSVVEEEHAIRFGLVSIKNFGAGLAESIMLERKARGAFSSLTDFLSRVKDKNLNKRALEALVKCGALDAFGERGELLHNMERLLAFSRDANEESSSLSLFGSGSAATLTLEKAPPALRREKLAWEKELLGLYLSGHPLDDFEEKLKRHGTSIRSAKKTALSGQTIVLAGLITEYKIIITKKSGERMAFLKLADKEDAIEAVLFPRVFEATKGKLRADICVVLRGTITVRNGEKSIAVEEVKLLE